MDMISMHLRSCLSTFLPKYFLQNIKNLLVAKRTIHGRTLGCPLDSWVAIGNRATVFQQHCCQFTILRMEQNGGHFTDNILQCIFLKENCFIVIEVSQKFDSKDLFDKKSSTLVQIMSNCLGAEQTTSHNLKQWWLMLLKHAHMCDLASVS